MTKRKLGLSATALRWFALGCMLLDHLWGTIIPGNEWMTCLGRLAFPIFAFQVAEGYLHTHDFKSYSNRIMLCIIISEIPFDLMMFGTAFYPFHQNVMMTLWLGLMSIHTIDQVRKKRLHQADWPAPARLHYIPGLRTAGRSECGGILSPAGFPQSQACSAGCNDRHSRVWIRRTGICI